jgi:tetratricopeptide (TPR) repeat protein
MMATRWNWLVGLAALLAAWVPGPPAAADTRRGASAMTEPTATALLLDYFDQFLRERDVEAFRRAVRARYTEGTLERLVRSGPVAARRAAVVALGLVGGLASNATVAHALSDSDPVVRRFAQNALWAIWFRADTPENNAELERVRLLIGGEHLDEAIAAAGRLIGRAPRFAEAYNQRAIAYFASGRFEDSAADCRRALERNPYHIGALAGLGQCFIELGRRDEALEVFRRAFELQPFNDDLRQAIDVLEAPER